MIQKFVGITLLLFILFSSLPHFQAEAKTKSCETEECIQSLVNQLENLNSTYKSQCLAEGIKDSEIEDYYKNNGLSEECWKIIIEVVELEKKLKAHEATLENKLECMGENCSVDNPSGLNSEIINLSSNAPLLQCNDEYKKKINSSCVSDRECALVASAQSLGGPLFKLMAFKVAPKNCHLDSDSCFTQIGTSFLRSVVSLFEFGGDILSSAFSSFWRNISQKEDHASTSQLALAKASEDPGFFKRLVDDFPGTLMNIWNGFLSGMEQWLKFDIFCAKWTGVPHFSECIEPSRGFDCMSCKAQINGVCSVAGVIASEVIPSFLTGGLVAAAKYGAKVSLNIAKSFKISSKARVFLKESQLAKLAVKTGAKINYGLKLSNKFKHSRILVQKALSITKQYYLSPVRKIVKSAFEKLSKLAKLPGLNIALNGTKRVLLFAGKTLKFTGKVVLYPVNNPATTFAYRAGEKSFNKIMRLSTPKLGGVPGSALFSTLSKHPDLERILAEIEAQNLSKAPSTKRLLELDEELLKTVSSLRKEIIAKNLDLDLDLIISDFYPELKYGGLSQKIGFNKVIEAENELLSVLDSSPNGKKLKEYIIISNSKLSPTDRLEKAMIQIKKIASPKLAVTLQNAHQFGEGSVFSYSWSALRGKYRILTEGGFSPSEADELIRAGYVGNPPAGSIILHPGENNQSLAHSAITHDLYEGEITSIRRFSENDNRNEIFLVTIKGDPTREAIFKPRIFGDIDGWARTPMEYVAYFLNRKLGMDYVPPTAYRKGLNLKFEDKVFTEGSFSFKAPEYKAMSKLENQTFQVSGEEILSDHRVLSVLLENPDGHFKNLGLGRHWVDGVERPVFLDWNACLRPGTDISMTKYTATGNTLPVTKIRQETLDHLKNLSREDFKPIVEVNFITPEEVNRILVRRDEILKYFDDLIKNAKSKEEVVID